MLLKRFLIGIILLSFMFHHSTVVCSAPNQSACTEQIQNLSVKENQSNYITIEYSTYFYLSSLTENELSTTIEEISTYIHYLESLPSGIIEVEQELQSMNDLLVKYKLDLEKIIAKKIHYKFCAKQYPEATYVWIYMKENFGWSDIICAGIMGNIMAEIGGGSAEGALGFGDKWKIDKASGLGMFQWTAGRRKEIKTIYGNAPTIEQQLDFMYNELYGFNGVTQQVKSNELDAILNAETPEQVAANFARYFERCASFSYTPRKNYARFAYDYFVY